MDGWMDGWREEGWMDGRMEANPIKSESGVVVGAAGSSASGPARSGKSNKAAALPSAFKCPYPSREKFTRKLLPSTPSSVAIHFTPNSCAIPIASAWRHCPPMATLHVVGHRTLSCADPSRAGYCLPRILRMPEAILWQWQPRRLRDGPRLRVANQCTMG